MRGAAGRRLLLARPRGLGGREARGSRRSSPGSAGSRRPTSGSRRRGMSGSVRRAPGRGSCLAARRASTRAPTSRSARRPRRRPSRRESDAVFIESSTKVTESEARSAAASRAGEVAFRTGAPKRTMTTSWRLGQPRPRPGKRRAARLRRLYAGLRQNSCAAATSVASSASAGRDAFAGRSITYSSSPSGGRPASSFASPCGIT